MPVLKTSKLIRWSCPVNPSKSPPQKDTDGSRLLIHVQDNAGNDFQIWCVPTLLSGFYYEFSISFPSGSVQEISRCIYSLGLNDAEIVYQGPMSEVTSPTGTPVINVGKIMIVQHSNKEAIGSAMTGNLTPKPGGKDFHMVYDYTRKWRYRLNTVVGRGAISTDYFACFNSHTVPGHSIVRAEAVPIRSLLDFNEALSQDTEFRKIDDPNAIHPGDHYEFQTAHTDDHPIGYVFINNGQRSGAVLLDPTLCGTSFTLLPQGIEGSAPPIHSRTRSTLAVERSLFPKKGNDVNVTVDGKTTETLDVRPTDSMIVFDFPLDDSAHSLLFEERTISTSKKGK